MTSNEDSTPGPPKKPGKTFGPPKGGIALFGANVGLLGEMKSRLKKPNDPAEGTEPSACDNPESEELNTHSILPPVAALRSSVSPTGTSRKEIVGSANELDSSLKTSPHVIEEPPPSPTKSSLEGDKLHKTNPAPPPLIMLSDCNDLATSTQKIYETDEVYRRRDVTQGDEHLLRNLNKHRPHRPKTRPPTVYRSAQSTSTYSSSADGPCGDEQISPSPSCSDEGNLESRASHLDKFFDGLDVDA